MTTTKRPQDDREITEAERLLTDAQVLMKAGRSEQWIRDQWLASGIAAPHVDILMKLLTEDLPKAQRKAKAKVLLGMVAVPLLLIGGVFGIVKIVQAAKGPNAYALAATAVEAACNERPRSVGAMDLDGEVVLTSGSGLARKYIVSGQDLEFAEMVLDGDDLAVGRVLCSDVVLGASTRCEGYYSPEVIKAIESSDTVEQAAAQLWAHPDPDGARFVDELIAGGRTVNVKSSRLDVRLVDLGGGTLVDETTVDVAATCPDSHYSSGYSLNDRSSPEDAHTVLAIEELTGVVLPDNL